MRSYSEVSLGAFITRMEQNQMLNSAIKQWINNPEPELADKSEKKIRRIFTFISREKNITVTCCNYGAVSFSFDILYNNVRTTLSMTDYDGLMNWRYSLIPKA